MRTEGVTYAEIRQWARWLELFTAGDLANALHAHPEIGSRGVKALLHQRICIGTGEFIDGPDGPEQVIEYVPLPNGPRIHPTETPPEVRVAREMGGDPLRVPRGMPVGNGRKLASTSVTGRRRPGRRNGMPVPGR